MLLWKRHICASPSGLPSRTSALRAGLCLAARGIGEVPPDFLDDVPFQLAGIGLLTVPLGKRLEIFATERQADAGPLDLRVGQAHETPHEVRWRQVLFGGGDPDVVHQRLLELEMDLDLLERAPFGLEPRRFGSRASG